MNHAQTVDHELRLFNQFKAEGKRLLHFCPDWDDMAIHSEMNEIAACCCDFATEADNILRDQRTQEIEEKRNDPMRATNMMIEAVKHAEMMEEPESTSQDFSTLSAPAHSGTELSNRVAVACMLVSNDAFKKPGWQKEVNDLLREMRNRIEGTKLTFTEDQLRTAVAQAREADIDLATAIWGNLLMDCEKIK